MLSNLDYVLLQFGQPGHYQIFIGFLLCCLQLPITFTLHLWKYYTDEPAYRCYIPDYIRNGTHENDWTPKTDRSYSSCSMYIDVLHQWKGVKACSYGYEYKSYGNEHNIIMEWDLVCNRKYMVNLLFYISTITAIIGCLIFGMMADRFERKKILLIALYLFVAVAFSLHFVGDFTSFFICFSLQTFFIAAVHLTSYVLLIEILPTPYQLQASLYYTAFNVVSSMLLPLIVWMIKSWRYVQLAICAPGIVFFAHMWILPRSSLWLISEGRIYEAENLIEELSKQNGRPLVPSFRLHLQNFLSSIKGCNGLNEKRHQILSKFSSSSLRWNLLCHFYLFFVLSLSMDVTESQALHLHEIKYADYFYRALMDLGILILIYYFVIRIGPRPIQAMLFICSGLLMMSSITLQEILPNPTELANRDDLDNFDYRLYLLPPALVSCARTLIKSLPAFICYHAIKTLPTGIRCIGFASCICWSIVGQMAAPNLLVLADLIAPFIPIGLCGSLSVIAGGLSLLFPDCWRKPLPNNLKDIEQKTVEKKKFIPSTDLKTCFTMSTISSEKTDAKILEDDINTRINSRNEMISFRPSLVYGNDDLDITELDERQKQNNCHFYSHNNNNNNNNQHHYNHNHNNGNNHNNNNASYSVAIDANRSLRDVQILAKSDELMNTDEEFETHHI